MSRRRMLIGQKVGGGVSIVQDDFESYIDGEEIHEKLPPINNGNTWFKAGGSAAGYLSNDGLSATSDGAGNIGTFDTEGFSDTGLGMDMNTLGGIRLTVTEIAVVNGVNMIIGNEDQPAGTAPTVRLLRNSTNRNDLFINEVFHSRVSLTRNIGDVIVLEYIPSVSIKFLINAVLRKTVTTGIPAAMTGPNCGMCWQIPATSGIADILIEPL